MGDYRLAAVGAAPADQHPANWLRHEVTVVEGEGDVFKGLRHRLTPELRKWVNCSEGASRIGRLSRVVGAGSLISAHPH